MNYEKAPPLGGWFTKTFFPLSKQIRKRPYFLLARLAHQSTGHLGRVTLCKAHPTQSYVGTHSVICYGPSINWSSPIPVDFVFKLQRTSFINSNTFLYCKNCFSDLLLTFYNVFKLKALLGKLLVAAICLPISQWNSYFTLATFFSITAVFKGL